MGKQKEEPARNPRRAPENRPGVTPHAAVRKGGDGVSKGWQCATHHKTPSLIHIAPPLYGQNISQIPTPIVTLMMRRGAIMSVRL